MFTEVGLPQVIIAGILGGITLFILGYFIRKYAAERKVKIAEAKAKEILQTAGKEEYSISETKTDRIVFQSLQSLFRNGKIFIYNVPSRASSDSEPQRSRRQTREIYLRPDLQMFESYNRSVLAIIDKYQDASIGTYQSMKIVRA